MKFRQRVGVLLAAFLVALGAGAVAATPAQAAWSDCYYNDFCVWTNGNFPGGPDWAWYVSPTPSGTGFCANFTDVSGLNDNVDGIALSGSNPRSATIYENINCSGRALYYIATVAYGGPPAGTCNVTTYDAWACYWPQTGWLPSSAWITRA